MKINIYDQGGETVKKRKYKIAAIVPNYNYADYIVERIDSILLQTYPVSQIIILDDASKDNSVEVIEKKIEKIKKEYPKLEVLFIKNDENSGGRVFRQWQKGLKKAKADYIWIAEADDSADRHFLEMAMQKFAQHPDAVLYYSDSLRINQENEVISESCADWADLWKCGRWENDYYSKGRDEITKYLSANNTILNVSSVVWKSSKRLMKIFKEAEEYRIAGDWYIYTRVLEEGGIIYVSQPLNYYRKHGGVSVTNNMPLDDEYKEVKKIQDRVAAKFELSEGQLAWQRKRVKLMGVTENKMGKSKGKIAWIGVDFGVGSGGFRTIVQNINYLADKGYECDLYIEGAKETSEELKQRIIRDFSEIKANVHPGKTIKKKYDMVVATYYDTVKYVSELDIKHKVYFVQDYEPWFFPACEQFINAEDSYKMGLTSITIGKWLSYRLEKHFPDQPKPEYFNFCADLDVYRPIKGAEKENAICAILQPEKPRRCTLMELKALQIVKKMRPETKIYVYGSPVCKTENLEAEHLGIIPVNECNQLYNKCLVGLCLSASNTSRIPFEMMAAGLPVVELYRDNNLYDLPEDGVLLAEPNAEALATAIIKLLDDAKLRERMSIGGEKYMREFPLEVGFEQFANAIDRILGNKNNRRGMIEKIYKREPIRAGSIGIFDLPEVKLTPYTKQEVNAQLGLKKRIIGKVKRTLKIQ